MGMRSGKRLPSSAKKAKAKKAARPKKKTTAKRKATKKKTARPKKETVRAKKATKTKRASAKRAVAKKTVAKRAAAKKAAAKKAAAKKAAAKKAAAKKAAATRAAAKMAAAKRAAATRAAAKKAAAKRAAAKKAAATRAAAKKAAAEKAAAKKSAAKVQALRDLAKRIVAVTEVNDDEASFALYASNVESAEVGRPPTKGLTALREKFAMWRQMVQDARFVARNVLVDANTIVIEWEGTATLRASGQAVELHEIAIHEIKGGKIARERFYYDPAALQPDEPEEAPEVREVQPEVTPPLFSLSSPDDSPNEPGFAWSREDPEDPEGV